MKGRGIAALAGRDGRWRVRVWIGAERINLGALDTIQNASRCVLAVSRVLGLPPHVDGRGPRGCGGW